MWKLPGSSKAISQLGRIVAFVLLTASSSFGAATASVQRVAQGQITLAELKSAFVLNFGRFVEWPASVLEDGDKRFVICVIGEDPLGSSLDAVIQGQKIKDRAPEVLRLSPDSPVSRCQIAYINVRDARRRSELLVPLQSRPVLTVADTSGFLDAGGMIELRVVEDQIRLKINVEAARRAGLTVSSKLLAIAEVVP